MQKTILVLVTTTIFGCSSGGSAGDLGARDLAGGGGGDMAGGGGADMAGGGMEDLAMAGPTCGASAVNSPCGAAAVVRATVTLAAGMQDKTGTLVLLMNHYRLGSSTMGGVPHSGATRANATLSATKGTDISLDMCDGGEMWSEDNCEFNFIAFLDSNNNMAIDQGEPAGRTIGSVSCKGSQPCFPIELNCMNGAVCGNYTDPGACKCGAVCPNITGGKIVTCQ